MDYKTKYRILLTLILVQFALTVLGAWFWNETVFAKDMQIDLLVRDHEELQTNCDDLNARHNELVSNWNDLVPAYETLQDDCAELATECQTIYDQYSQCSAAATQDGSSELNSFLKLLALLI